MMDKCEVGQKVRVTWSGRIGAVVAIHPHRDTGVRVMLEGETEHWGFNYNELEAAGGN